MAAICESDLVRVGVDIGGTDTKIGLVKLHRYPAFFLSLQNKLRKFIARTYMLENLNLAESVLSSQFDIKKQQTGKHLIEVLPGLFTTKSNAYLRNPSINPASPNKSACILNCFPAVGEETAINQMTLRKTDALPCSICGICRHLSYHKHHTDVKSESHYLGEIHIRQGLSCPFFVRHFSTQLTRV